MKRRILSIVLALIMLISIVPASALGTEEEITVYVSLSRYGELLRSKDGETMAYVPVTLSGGGRYNLDDCFIELHNTYHPLGDAAYSSSISDWGFGIDKLWNDTSYNFGYQVNAGSESVMGLEHLLKAGDHIDVCIYKNLYPDTEAFAHFNAQKINVAKGREFTLTLTYASGYDEYWNSVYSPCDGADILVDGVPTELVTDANGQVALSFENAGTYIVSAKKNKMLKEETVPAITAPVCIVNVLESEISLIHGIAEMYAESDLTDAGGNLPWIVADMAAYEELYPESSYCFSETQEESALRLLTEFAKDAERPGDLAKTILAMRALGYDAARIFTENYEHIDLVEKLKKLVETEDEAVTNIYTLPYVIIALGQTDTRLVEILLSAAIMCKDEWQSVSDGTDAITPMIAALAPYANNRADIREIIEESVLILKDEQREDGLIDGFEGYESASTGLAVWALSTVGENASTVICDENSLIDGLLSVSNDELNAFPNAFATEQGFRGLLAWQLFTEKNDKTMYDFSNFPAEEINYTGADFCPVKFDISPANAEIYLDEGGIIGDNLYDLYAGEYTYEINAQGYRKITDSFTVSDEETKNHVFKTINVSLRKKSNGGAAGGTLKPSAPKDEIEEKPIVESTVDPTAEPEIDTEKTTPVAEIFADVKPDAWYNKAVQYVYDKSLFGGTELGFEPDRAMTRGMLVTVLFRLDNGKKPSTEVSFTDVEDDSWYAESISWAAGVGVVKGVTDKTFAPDENITREQLAVILYRYALFNGIEIYNVKEISFEDANDVSEYAREAISYVVGAGIVTGKDNNKLCPGEIASRAEVAAMLMRFAEVINK